MFLQTRATDGGDIEPGFLLLGDFFASTQAVVRPCPPSGRHSRGCRKLRRRSAADRLGEAFEHRFAGADHVAVAKDVAAAATGSARAPASRAMTRPAADPRGSAAVPRSLRTGAAAPSPRELLVLQALGFQGVRPQPAFLVFFVVLEIAFEPFHMRVTLECEDMRADPVKEEAVV